MDQELTIESKNAIGKQVEFTDPNGKYRIGKVRSIRNYDATIELPDWHYAKDDDGLPIETKIIHSKMKVPKEFIKGQITQKFTRKILWPNDKRPKFKVDQIALEYKKVTNHKAKHHKSKIKAKRLKK